MEIFQAAVRDEAIKVVVPCKPSVEWKFSSLDLNSISVQPSLDASASGHWHGHITSGAIT